MGTPKAALEWHGSTLLRRTVGILARATGGPVVVVRASGQDLPDGVVEFIRAAGSGGGASLEMLSDTVRKWITDRGLEGTFVVVTRRPTE